MPDNSDSPDFEKNIDIGGNVSGGKVNIGNTTTIHITTNQTSAKPHPIPFPYKEKLPEDFIPRPDELESIIKLLVDESHRTVAITAALKGAGGYGKTTLARAVIHDERIKRKFKDGILWITLGENPGELTGRVLDLIEALTGERPGYKSEEAENKLAEELKDLCVLIVVDDVWDAAQSKPFMMGGTQCAHLITTRDSATLPVNVPPILVDAMKPAEAAELLGKDLKDIQQYREIVLRLAKRLGGWVLLIKLVNATLYDLKKPASEALQFIDEALTKKGLVFFKNSHDPIERHRTVAAVLGVSFDRLGADTELYMRLAIFAEDTDIPEATLMRLWGRDEYDTAQLCTKLHSLSLLLLYEGSIVRLHDTVRTYMREIHVASLPNWNLQFLETYQQKEWHNLPENELYLQHQLAYHLLEAQQSEPLRTLLMDFRYLQARLDRGIRHFGDGFRIGDRIRIGIDPNNLLTDFELYLRTREDEALRLICSAIRMSVPALSQDTLQLASQLIGRLFLHRDKPEIAEFLGEILPPDGSLIPLNAALNSASDTIKRVRAGYSPPVQAVAYSPDGKWLASGSGDLFRGDNELIVWNAHTGQYHITLEGNVSPVRAVAYSPDGQWLVSGSGDSHRVDYELIMWNAHSGQLRIILDGFSSPVQAVAYSPDGKWLASGSNDKTIIIWDAHTGQRHTTLMGHFSPVWAVAYSPDGQWLASGADDKTVIIWDAHTGQLQHILEGHLSPVNAVAYSPDGQWLASGSDDETVIIWDAHFGQPQHTLKGHSSPVQAVAYSPDGRWIISTSRDKTIIIWNRHTGQKTARFYADSSVNCCAWSPDGQTLAAGDDAGRVMFLRWIPPNPTP